MSHVGNWTKDPGRLKEAINKILIERKSSDEKIFLFWPTQCVTLEYHTADTIPVLLGPPSKQVPLLVHKQTQEIMTMEVAQPELFMNGITSL